jgi:hypothetical protein
MVEVDAEFGPVAEVPSVGVMATVCPLAVVGFDHRAVVSWK